MKIFLVLVYITVHASSLVQPAVGETRCGDGDVQLVGGPNEFEGRVELCVGGRWVQVCGNGGWGQRHAGAVCNQVSNLTVIYLAGNVDSGYYSADDVSMNFVNVTLKCNPRGTFNNCVSEVHNQGCGNNFASVACPAIGCTHQNVRLSPITENPPQGFVELCYHRSGDHPFWSGVCHQNLTLAAATVICRQLGYLQTNLSVSISRSVTSHRYTYNSVDCVGNESRISDCQLNSVQIGARCSAAVVNCQVSFEDDTTENEVTSSSTRGEGPTDSEPPFSPTSQDMLAIITGAVCGFIIFLLLIIVILLIIVLIMRSRNRTRLKVAVPDILDNGSQQFSSVASGGTTSNIPTLNNPEPYSQNGSLQKLTITNANYQATFYPDSIRNAPMMPSDNFGYPLSNNEQRQPGAMFPQTHGFLVPEMVDPDTHIYAEPTDPVKDPRSHDYAQLEQTDHYYQNDPLLAPFPYEMPLSAHSSRNNTMQYTVTTHGESSLGNLIDTREGLADSGADDHEYAELDGDVGGR